MSRVEANDVLVLSESQYLENLIRVEAEKGEAERAT